MFIREIFKKRRRHITTNRIREIDLIGNNRNKLLKGEIIFGHCRGHDTLIVFFHFKGFHEQHIRLLSENYFSR